MAGMYPAETSARRKPTDHKGLPMVVINWTEVEEQAAKGDIKAQRMLDTHKRLHQAKLYRRTHGKM